MIYFPWITHTYTLLWASCEPVANAPWGESTGPHIPPSSLPHQHECSSAQGSLVTGQFPPIHEAGVRGSYYMAMH